MEKYILKNIKRPGSEVINKFSHHDVSTVYEAQGKIGLMNVNLRPIAQGNSMVGPAVTVVCPAEDNLMIHAAIEVCKPGDVLVVSTIGNSDSGMVGELIVKALMKRGVKGLVIDAGIRDALEIRKLGFPIWSKAIHSRGTTKNKGGWVNKEAVCGEVIVRPGDLIMADDDGVVVIDKNHVDSTLEATMKRSNREEETKEKINNNELSLDFYNLRHVLADEKVTYYNDEEELYSRKT